MQDRTDPHGFRLLAAVLAETPDTVQRLLVAHRNSGTGRCIACTAGGTGLPGDRWPCTPYNLAAEAARLALVDAARSPR